GRPTQPHERKIRVAQIAIRDIFSDSLRKIRTAENARSQWHSLCAQVKPFFNNAVAITHFFSFPKR
ncbi:MAG: hypothetical protein KJ936_02235, partial [Proteobacteria bacterium]|nr:hypothetical protein [Pseudomonadota bacterium]